MKLVDKDFFFEVYAGEYKGHEILFRRNVFTNEISLELSDEFAQSLGFKNLTEMMSDDGVLDKLNEYKKTTGDFPISKRKKH